MIPHFDGERTPNKPRAKGSFHGITHSNFTKENIARASIEGVIAGMIYAARAVERLGVSYSRILLIGGAAKNSAVQQISDVLSGREIYIPAIGDYVAEGAVKQAAWDLSGKENPPNWPWGEVTTVCLNAR